MPPPQPYSARRSEPDAIADALGIDVSVSFAERLQLIRARITAARATANVVGSIEESLAEQTADAAAENTNLAVALASFEPLMGETSSKDTAELGAAIQRSREARALRAAIAATETAIKSAGDGKSLEELLAAQEGVDPDSLAGRTQTLSTELATLNGEVAAAAAAHGDARTAFAGLETFVASAVDAATDAVRRYGELDQSCGRHLHLEALGAVLVDVDGNAAEEASQGLDRFCLDGLVVERLP